MNRYTTVGIMSGTSLDGLDMVLCEFVYNNKHWSFSVKKSETYKYSDKWIDKLQNAQNYSAYNFIALHNNYGSLIADAVNRFLTKEEKQTVDFIASHGHTIFHEPSKAINFQLGNGLDIAKTTGIKTIADFRSLDISLSGQGAPLVPIGDFDLFEGFDYYINLGGFANISYKKNNKIIAFDIVPCNFILNYVVSFFDREFDDKGLLGRTGEINYALLDKLNDNSYYKKDAPKSLGREFIEEAVLPIINNSNYINTLRSLYEHIAIQISKIIKPHSSCLITGGGAYNKFLIELIKEKTNAKITIPTKEIIEYKEAIIFAYLGLLRLENKINTLSSVTGAVRDSCGGVVFD